MRSRDHVNNMKEQLIFGFWRKINDLNKDLIPDPRKNYDNNYALGHREVHTDNDSHTDADGETIDSVNNFNNTPKSKKLRDLNRDHS